MSTPLPETIKARVISGEGRGRRVGFPTINCHLDDVTDDLEEGIYAGNVKFDEELTVRQAAIHYGPKPFYKEGKSFEVHIIDNPPDETPENLSIELVARLRDVEDFPSEEALKAQIQKDIDKARAILDKP